MSSPPPSASSPTGSSFTLPQKRPSLSNLAGGASQQKRRKASFASTSSHPLRQTSFPPPGAASPKYSPSRQSSFSPSVSSGVAGRTGAATSGKKRKQHGRAASQAADTASKTGQEESRPKKDTASKAGQDDEDGDDDEDNAEDTLLEASGIADAGSKEDNENLAMLIDAFDVDQEDRYAAYRRLRLKKEIVRRIVNQTLSQSVPGSIVTTINGYTKIFIGDLIERARDVQAEWLAAKQIGELKPASEHVDAHTSTEYERAFKIQEKYRGPLTPDHLREALRRYKKDQEGGNAGFQGLSLQGVEVAASRGGGRRLFR